jgi:hypothetical protein
MQSENDSISGDSQVDVSRVNALVIRVERSRFRHEETKGGAIPSNGMASKWDLY